MSAAASAAAQLLPRHRAALELPREASAGRERPARNRDLLDTLRPQVDAGELGHFARAEDEDVQAREVTENLPGQLDRGVADRDCALGEPGFVAAPACRRANAAWNRRWVTVPVKRRSLAVA